MISNELPNPTPLRIILAEDHALLSNGIKALLSSTPGYQVVGEVNDGLQVYSACQRWNPDIVLLDLGLPGMDGIDIIRHLKRRWSKLAIVVITADIAEYRARDAFQAGAIAYVLKKSPQQVLLAALETASLGLTYLDPDLNRAQVLEKNPRKNRASLTSRERQVLKLIAEGLQNQEIADSLMVSIKTVATHRLNLMRKLNARNAVELANWATRLGIH
ncbi:DNA-binding response regulator [Chromobacterium sp. Panama]|nr:DNA-binding response regulator [Chromobacterium sp. Panama]